MLDRRRLLLTASAVGAAAAAPAWAKPAAGKAAPATPQARLDAVVGRMFDTWLTVSPELCTTLGYDKGPRARQKWKLDDRSADAVHGYQGRFKVWAGELRGVDRKALTGMAAVNYDTLRYVCELVAAGADRFRYGVLTWPAQSFTAPSPYVVSQLTGAYATVPDFLDNQHTIESKADAEAYLARLNAFATGIDQDSARAKADAAAGATPPDFILDTTLTQLKALRKGLGPDSTLVRSLVRRAGEKHVAGDWGPRATKIVDGPVAAALDRQIAALEALRPKATHDAGAWRLPDGEAYYRWALEANTTTKMSPDEVHRTGVELVGQLSGRIDALFRAQGMSQGTTGQRLSALAKDPRFLYPNTEAGKAALLADLNGLVKTVSARLPQYFGTLPKAKLDIRRVPAAIEAGAPGGYYNGGSLDGSRPGAYYINLRDTAEWPKWTLPTLTYHEGIPGHHLQITLANEAKGIPDLRKAMGFNAYQEGWALYAEQLADEMGLYQGDPWGEIGYLHDALYRAVRLVVDTGLHAERWSREQAIRYMTEQLGEPEGPHVTEVERYCVWPGQACSYMIGKLTWLRLREQAKAALGSRFDIRKFHDAGLLAGAMPLDVLRLAIANWVASEGGKL
jgi:uncharacterized protein (DUF885 family)